MDSRLRWLRHRRVPRRGDDEAWRRSKPLAGYWNAKLFRNVARYAGMTKFFGCFWHVHAKANCLDARRPKSNTVYWNAKLARNVERDAANIRKLRALGWRVLIVWECETKDARRLSAKLRRFLEKNERLSGFD